MTLQTVNGLLLTKNLLFARRPFVSRVCCTPGFSCNVRSTCGQSCPDGGVDISSSAGTSVCLRPTRNPSRATQYLLNGVVHRNFCCGVRVVMSFSGFSALPEQQLQQGGRIYLGGVPASRVIGQAPPYTSAFTNVSEAISSDCDASGAWIYWTVSAVLTQFNGRLFTYRAPVILQSTAGDACNELYHADISMTRLGPTLGRCPAEGIPTGIGGWTLFSDHSNEPPFFLPPPPPVRKVDQFPDAFTNAGDRTLTRGGVTQTFDFPTVSFDYQLTDRGSPLP